MYTQRSMHSRTVNAEEHSIGNWSPRCIFGSTVITDLQNRSTYIIEGWTNLNPPLAWSLNSCWKPEDQQKQGSKEHCKCCIMLPPLWIQCKMKALHYIRHSQLGSCYSIPQRNNFSDKWRGLLFTMAYKDVMKEAALFPRMLHKMAQYKCVISNSHMLWMKVTTAS